MRPRVPGLVLWAWAAASCGGGPPAPVAIDLVNDVCAHCRMVISTRTTAAQLLAPGEEPRLFDDLGCLRSALQSAPPPEDSVIFVADHLSGEWVRLEDAVLTEVPGLQTPMGSGLVAHRSTADRDKDAAARGGRPYEASALRGGGRP
jgi:copper chaperone NosL